MGTGGVIKNFGVSAGTQAVTGGNTTADIGLLAGISSATIENCFTAGNVSHAADDGVVAGGLVGECKGTITHCYTTGNVSFSFSSSPPSDYTYAGMGGLVGNNAGYYKATIANCYATGNVAADEHSSTGSDMGGLVGVFQSSIINNAYRNSEASIKKNDKASIPNDDASLSKSVTPKTLAEMKTDTFKGLLNASGSVWGRTAGKNNDLPYIIGVGVGK